MRRGRCVPFCTDCVVFHVVGSPIFFIFRFPAVLLVPSQDVLVYLKRASQAREAAQLAVSDRKFHEKMEAAWMDLAASAALIERVDLFLHSLQSEKKPCIICGNCQRVAMVETIEAAHHIDFYTFRCIHCGRVEERTVVR
jgi:hypothetical protein